MRSSILILTSFVALATAQTGPTRAMHVFTIRKPEIIDAEGREALCSTEGACTDCGAGVCTFTEECGTWAGQKEMCCIQPYNFGSGDRMKCSDAAGTISDINVEDGSSDGDEPKVYSAALCPAGEVIVNESFFENSGTGNLTCCAAGKDAVVLESDVLSVPAQVLCIDQVTGSGGGKSPSSGDDEKDEKEDGGSKENAAGRVRLEIGALAFLVAAFVAGMV